MLRFRVASSREDSMRLPSAAFHSNTSNNNNNSLNSSNTSVKTTKTTNLNNILLNNNRIYSKTLAHAGINTNIGLIGNSSNLTNSFYPRTVLIAKNFRHSSQNRDKVIVPQTLANFPLVIQNNNSNKYAPPVSSVSSSSRSTTPKVMQSSSSQSRAGRMSSLESARSNATPIDCSCIICLNKLLLDKKQQKSLLKNGSLSIVDTKSFLNSLKNLKTSVKLESLDNEPNISYAAVLATPIMTDEQPENNNSSVLSRLKTPNSAMTGQSNTTRVLSKTSRIKLWKPNEINEFTNENRLAKSGKALKRDNSSISFRRAVQTSLDIRQNLISTTPDLDNKYNLNRVFQNLNLNPNLSPLLVQNKEKKANERPTMNQHEGSDSEHLWSLTNSDDFDDKYPRNPPTTPINPLFKVIITSKEKS